MLRADLETTMRPIVVCRCAMVLGAGWFRAAQRAIAALGLFGVVCGAAIAQAPATANVALPVRDTAEAVLAEAMRRAIGSPLEVDLGDEAILRLPPEQLFVPAEAANKLLRVTGSPPQRDMLGMLTGSDGLDMAGPIQFIPAGFVEADAMLTWTPDDILASIRDSLERSNSERVREHLGELEARVWVQPPHYDPVAHRLAWAVLIVPRSAPALSDGEVIYNAVAFGREGFIRYRVAASLEMAAQATHLTGAFLDGLIFQPGKGYQDATPQDRRADGGLAQALGVDSLHRARLAGRLWSSDVVIPAAGGLVAAIGGLSLLIYYVRHSRQEARRG